MSADQTRRDRAAAMADMGKGIGLEIGALDCPIAPRATYNVRYVDVVGTAALRERYRDDPNVSTEDIAEVDFALQDLDGTIRPLSEAGGRDAPYDWVVASHVIEHVPDLIGWLGEIAQVMVDDGRLLLMIPDRRFTFDVQRPQTTVGQILQAHTMGDTVSSERAVFDHFRSYVTVPTSDLWAGKPGIDFPKVFSFDEAAAMRQRTLDTGEYTDSHVWMFTPAVFVDQIVELGRLGLCDFIVDKVPTTAFNELEFYAALRRLPRGLDDAQLVAELAGGIQVLLDAPTELAPMDAEATPFVVSDREIRAIRLKRKAIERVRGLHRST